MAESELPVEEWRGLPDHELIARAAMAAGDISLRYFKRTNKVWYKGSNSPVSEADHAVDRFLRETFKSTRPEYGWLSEETDDDPARLENQKVLIVDPIDGTRGFIDGHAQWCISIAIVEAGRPVEAILHCPVLKRTYQARAAQGTTQNGTLCQTGRPPQQLRVTGSKKLIKNLQAKFEGELDIMDFIPSLALRIAMVAGGELDAAFARPGACEWDIAAADLILEEAGGKLTTTNGEALRYNCPRVEMPALIAASGGCYSNMLELANKAGILQ